MSPTSVGSLWLPGFDPHFQESVAFTEEPEALLPEPAAIVTDDAALSISGPPLRWRPESAANAQPSTRAIWPKLARSDLLGTNGAAGKFEANLAAIDSLRLIEANAVAPTPGQRAALLRFTGWGGIPASFNQQANDRAWARRAAQLHELLDAADHESALASVTTATTPRSM